MSELTFRPAVPTDFDLLLTLHRDAMGEYIEATWGPWQHTAQREFLRERLARGLLRVVMLGEEVIGLWEVECHHDRVELLNVELAPAHQRRGHGTVLVGELLRGAAPRPVELQVLKVNPARRLYTRLGFEVWGETPTHYQMRWTPPAMETRHDYLH